MMYVCGSGDDVCVGVGMMSDGVYVCVGVGMMSEGVHVWGEGVVCGREGNTGGQAH